MERAVCASWKISTEGVAHSTRELARENAQLEALERYAFNRFAYVPWAVLISLVINLLSLPQLHLMRKRIAAQYEKDLELDRQSNRLEIANTVRHNIRTPLAALIRLSDTVRFRADGNADASTSWGQQTIDRFRLFKFTNLRIEARI